MMSVAILRIEYIEGYTTRHQLDTGQHVSGHWLYTPGVLSVSIRPREIVSGEIFELLTVAAAAAVCTAALTYPFVFQMAHVGRVDNADGQFSIWNVAWVAHALGRDPLHLFDANIFYPRRWTLAYSEPNLGAGVLAAPLYWTTGNVYLAHNSAVVLSFILSAVGAYCLVRHLTGDRRAAAVSAISFAFCPYVLGRTSHIQLMMTAGLPFAMLAFHRLVERPRARRGVALGATMAAEAAFCGYYGVLGALMIGVGVLVVAATRRWWANRGYWIAVGVGALAAIALALPIFLPFFFLHRTTGFERPLVEAALYSANWPAYLASPTFGSSWMLRFIGHYNEVLFPGFFATAFGVAGFTWGWRRGGEFREVAILYGTLAIFSIWASFGPAAGLYRALYATIPLFIWLRAPARFAILATLAASVLAGVGVHALLLRVRRPAAVAAGLAVCAAVELITPLRFRTAPAPQAVYTTLATLPRGPLLELPIYSPRFAMLRATYMLSSTVHWMPLIDAYSDYIPDDFTRSVGVLNDFPSAEAFSALERISARYVVFHLEKYNGRGTKRLRRKLAEFEPYLRQRYADDEAWLYEIVGFPPPTTEGSGSGRIPHASFRIRVPGLRQTVRVSDP
jgi:hypothetical protein